MSDQQADLKLVILAQMQPLCLQHCPTAPSDWFLNHQEAEPIRSCFQVLKQTERKVFWCGEAPEGE